MKKVPVPIGERFGKYVVLSGAEPDAGKTKYLCRCDCGTVRAVYRNNLIRRPNGSCGCLSIERISKLNLKHGLSDTPEHNIWMTMKERCYNPKNHKYPIYGGKGIKVCERWLNNFSNFIEDMGKRPTVKHSIDRKDVLGNYEPDNCRWATATEQARNKTTNRIITTPWGEITVAEAAEKAGVKQHTIHKRIEYGFTGEDLFSKTRLKRRF